MSKIEEHKLVVLGSGGVGKSAITVQFIQGTFVEVYDPTIEDSYRKQASVDGIQVFFSVLDTAGQEEYKALRDQHIRSGDGFLLVYSIVEHNTFEDVRSEIFPQILRVKDAEVVPMILVGNKCDLENQRTVSKSEAQQFADNGKIAFMETSAKFKKNIDESFFEVVRQIRRLNKGVKKDSGKTKCSIL